MSVSIYILFRSVFNKIFLCLDTHDLYMFILLLFFYHAHEFIPLLVVIKNKTKTLI
jgi:hypothetical protein